MLNESVGKLLVIPRCLTKWPVAQGDTLMDTILGLSQSQNHKVQAKAILLHTFLAYTYPHDSLGPITGSIAGQVLFLTAFSSYR